MARLGHSASCAAWFGGHGPALCVFSLNDLPACDCRYWGTSMTIAEDDYETTRDATMERGMQAAYTHEHSW